MANGRINFGKQSGGVLGLLFPDGATNTEVTLPASGVIATTTEVSSAITGAVQTGLVALKTIATGTTTFTATTNNINLTGIGIGVEIGDVIQISGAEDSKNNSEFTIEVITDENNVIVNQVHSNKGTSKNVAARVNDTGVTVKLLAKWYNAPIGLGQDWIELTSSRASSTPYPNPTNRTIKVSVKYGEVAHNLLLSVNGVNVSEASNNNGRGNVYAEVSKGSSYTLTGTFNVWREMR